ncbi:MAG: GntR family transcriptional regulator [Bryobacterales bacterium]|nr:GntR family transcriptional regulator [Bryobacteraceae bacterium]MDW8354651.1 GntR family transcriptional regulator [Bryobacterales bacterium]
MASARRKDESLRRKAYHYIQHRILSGMIRPGTTLSELALARETRMSRTPIREAIHQLLAEGWLEHAPGGRVVVTSLERDDIVELYELREALEVYAVRKAACRGLPPADRGLLRELCERIRAFADLLRTSGRERLNEMEMEEFLSADMKFHLLLLRGASNRRLMKLVTDTRLLTRIFSFERPGHDAALLERIYQYHSGIVEALMSGDGERAAQLLGEHIRASLQERLELFDQWQRESELQDLLTAPLAAPGRSQ